MIISGEMMSSISAEFLRVMVEDFYKYDKDWWCPKEVKFDTTRDCYIFED